MSTNSMTDRCILTGTNCTTSLTTPQFIDTFHCLCALEPSRASTDSTADLWRCIGNTTDNGTAGGNTGKWWYTVNANSNLEGFGEPLNSASDPPDLGKAYMLADGGDGELSYVVYNGTGVEMVDEGCTAKNDTKASTQYYGKREAAASHSTGSTSTATSINASPSQSSQSSTTALPIPTATPLVSSSPTQSGTSPANRVPLSTLLLYGLCFSAYASLFLR